MMHAFETGQREENGKMAHANAYATRNADFSDAIRSIALQTIEGDDEADRRQHLANYMRIPRAEIDYQVSEMVDLLRD
jgi:outer membrane receptor for monomeric catechols